MLGQWAGTRQYHVYNQRGCLLAGCRRVSPAVAACWLLPLHSHRPARAIHARAVTCQLITIISIMPICPEWWNAVNRWIVRCQLRTYQSHNRNEYLRDTNLDIFIDSGSPNDRYRCISSNMEKIEETKFSLNFTIFSRN